MRPMISGAGAGGGHLMDKQSLVTVVKELWNASEIQILILVSLSLQVFLFLFAGMRRRSSGWFLQTVLWLAYLSADSVAVFVLGHLAVRASEPGHQLVSLWAPFVLVHLGGQDTITAFSKQDNELWRRHLLNLVTQVAVAGYVVAKASWPDARLRAAMVLVFLCGCVKYAERTVSLYSADTERLRRWSQYDLSEKLKGQQHERGKRWLKKMAGTRDEAEQDTWATLKMMEKGSSSGPPNELFWDAVTLVADIISVDAPLNQAQSITAATHHDFLPRMLEEFLSRESRHSAYEHVGALLEQCYRRLYTKDPLRVTIIESFDKVGSPMHIFTYLIALFILILTTTATAVALALFTAADKRDHQLLTSRVDITVTYVLLVGAIALEVSSAALFIFPHLSFYLPCLGSLAKCTQSVLLPCCTKQWSQELRQYNIINTAGMFFIGQWFACDVKSKPVTNDHMSIKEFILDTLLVSGTRKEWRIASTRGQLALHNYRMDRHQHDEHYSPDQHPATTTTLKLLEETFRSSTNFPTSVLILHIATDICYHFGGTNHSDSGHDEAVVMKHKQTSTELSNYIMYLVFKCGVMLTTNSQVVHDSARKDIYKVLSQSQKVDPRNKDAPAMKLFEAIKKQQEEDSMGEIQIRHHPEPEKQQDPTIETEIQESTGIDDDNTAEDDYMKKLKRTSKALNSPVLPRAVTVAQELISINDEAERWKLIAAVWAEMLYYTAPRCGGGFHYEHLSTGGEFVSHVLVLMYYLGPFLPPPPDA